MRSTLLVLFCCAGLCAGASLGACSQVAVQAARSEAHLGTSPQQSATSSSESSADGIATLMIRWGSLLVGVVSLLSVVLAGVSIFSVAKSGSSYEESRKLAAGIKELHDTCAQLVGKAREQAASLQHEIERIQLDAAIHDLALEGQEDNIVRRRYVAVTQLGERGHSEDIPFLFAAFQRDGETDDNKAEIARSIAKIVKRGQPSTEEGNEDAVVARTRELLKELTIQNTREGPSSGAKTNQREAA